MIVSATLLIVQPSTSYIWTKRKMSNLPRYIQYSSGKESGGKIDCLLCLALLRHCELVLYYHITPVRIIIPS